MSEEPGSKLISVLYDQTLLHTKGFFRDFPNRDGDQAVDDEVIAGIIAALTSAMNESFNVAEVRELMAEINTGQAQRRFAKANRAERLLAWWKDYASFVAQRVPSPVGSSSTS